MKIMLNFRTFACLLILLPGVSSAGAVDVVGAGSTAAAPLYMKWQDAYAKKTGVTASYQAIGSSAGIKKITDGVVDFGASDAPMPATEQKTKNLVIFPTVILGIVPFVNVPGVKAGDLHLTAEILVGIYSGKITMWNDRSIAEINSSISLPKLPIVPVARSDGSGTTYLLSDYFNRVDPTWKVAFGTGFSVKWPAAVTTAKGSAGLVANVKKTPGAIGYAEYSYVIEHNLDYIMLKNRDGHFVKPNAESFKAALAQSQWAKTGEFEEALTDKPGPKSWPITGSTYILVPRVTSDPRRTAEALKFFTWAFISGDAIADSLDYVRLPDRVQARVFHQITSIVDRSGTPLQIAIEVK